MAIGHKKSRTAEEFLLTTAPARELPLEFEKLRRKDIIVNGPKFMDVMRDIFSRADGHYIATCTVTIDIIIRIFKVVKTHSERAELSEEDRKSFKPVIIWLEEQIEVFQKRTGFSIASSMKFRLSSSTAPEGSQAEKS